MGSLVARKGATDFTLPPFIPYISYHLKLKLNSVEG